MKTGTRPGGGRLRSVALAIVAVALLCSTGLVTAGAAQPAPPKFLGPLLSKSENPNVTLGRDGGFSVALPNGKNLWVFADTPRLEWIRGAWRLKAYFGGSSAAVLRSFTPGKPPTGRLIELAPGKTRPKTANAAPFIPMPNNVYMPNGSGKRCDKKNGTPSTNRVRWPVGAALMPDKTNVLVPYVITCVESSYFFTAQGWGFTRYNWKTNKFSQQPADVFPAKADGSGRSSRFLFGSPIIVGKRVTFYSWECCNTDGGVFQTTLDLSALKNPAAYQPQLLPGVHMTFDPSVAAKSKTHSRYSMFVRTDFKGGYELYSSTTPQGPWTPTASGVLPRCDKSPVPCHSLYIHPELSPAGRLLVSYHLPAFGPGDPSKHPYPKEPLRHVVMASVPCNC
jgi:hypothetical protein